MDRLFTSSVLAALALAWCSFAGAADIYRWVDKDGRTQLSDKVPEEYKDKAVKIDRAPQPTAEEKRIADERAARDRAKAGIGAAPAGTPPPKAGASAGKPAVAAKPAGGDACTRSWDEFNKAQECFAPFRLANGGLKEGAVEKCGQGGVQPSCAQPQN